MRRPKMTIPPLRRQRTARSTTPLTQQFRSYHSSRVNRSLDDHQALPKRDNITSRSEKKRTSRSFGTIAMRVVGVCVVVYALYSLVVLDTTVNVSPLSLRSDTQLLRQRDDYKNTAQSILASSPLYRTKITINVTEFETKMKQAFPEIADARISMPLLGHRPVLDIVAKQPVLIVRNGQDSYVVDKNGQAIIRTSDASGVQNLGLPAIEDQGGLDMKVGDVVLTKESVAFMGEFHRLCSELQLTPESYTIPAAFNEMHARFKGVPYTIKVLTENDARQTVGEYVALRQRLEQDGKTPAEYIDLRASERAYYK